MIRGRLLIALCCLSTPLALACSKTEKNEPVQAEKDEKASGKAVEADREANGDRSKKPAVTTDEKERPDVPAPETRPFDEAAQKALYETELRTLDGEPTTLAAHRGKALLLVNVASKCGLTPQYEGLERLQKKYADRGFSVVGFPCNQFGGQEPGTAEEIKEFCSTTYGVTFPMMEKIEVNGDGRHPIYKALTAITDQNDEAGDIKWNFEKFLVSADGTRIIRFRPKTEPESPQMVAAIEAALPASK